MRTSTTCRSSRHVQGSFPPVATKLPTDIADLAVAVEACERLLSKRKRAVFDNDDALKFYNQLLKQTLPLAQSQSAKLLEADLPRHVLAAFFANTAHLIWEHRGVEWEFGWEEAKVAKKVEELATSAIEIREGRSGSGRRPCPSRHGTLLSTYPRY